MKKISCYSSCMLLICVWCGILTTLSRSSVVDGSHVVKREERSTLVSTEYGEISAVRVTDNINGSYLLHFFTLEPNSLFLPVILHADMVFYVHTGSGKLQWTEEDKLKSTDLRRGDAYRLQAGSIFFIQSNLETETERQKLRIHAIFANSDNDLHEPITGPYSSITDMVLGFDKKVLLAAFKVSEEDIEELVNGTKQPAIIHGVPKTKSRTTMEMEAQFIGSFQARRSYNILELNKKKKKGGAKLFNLLKEDKDFENCNGWSTTVTRKKLSALKGTNVGLFMVNLTIGSMMGPHWNPMASEISVVLQGRGMVRVVCSNETGGCRNMRYEVEEGDVFVVPRFHAMAQMAFNNETFVFMGFSTSAKKNHPQYLAGQASVLRTLDKDVLGKSLNVMNTTLDQLLGSQEESVILGCVSCAEEELRRMEEEREREEEEAREREEERKKEEAARKREEEERKRREEEEEEARRKEEEARKREEEEEEARREEEEKKRREEEEEEAARKEEERKRREEEEEAAREEEEEARKREEEEEEARREEEEKKRREKEEEAARKEEERKRREEEEAAQEEEERKRREEEEEAAREEEEAARRREEEEAAREEEAAAARRREEEERKKEKEEKASRREEEEEAARREEEERQREEEEEAARREEEERQREEEAAAEASKEERWQEQQGEEDEDQRWLN